jgi:hypothetical protein
VASIPARDAIYELTSDITHLIVMDHCVAAFVTCHVLFHFAIERGGHSTDGESATRIILLAHWKTLGNEYQESTQSTVLFSPLQLIPPQPSLHPHSSSSGRGYRWVPSAREPHSESVDELEARSEGGPRIRTWSQAVNSSKAGWTFTLAVVRIAFPKLWMGSR